MAVGRGQALAALEARIGALDDSVESGGRSPLSAFVRVMEAYTDTRMDELAGSDHPIDPEVADAVAARSSLLRKLASEEPGIVKGPLERDRQLWTETGAFGTSGARAPASPTSDRFTPVVDPRRTATGKPAAGGFHTSTATSSGLSAWEIYLEPYAGSNLYPVPWFTWELVLGEALAPVREITSAVDWVHFVEDHGFALEGHLVPDWTGAARCYSGVHITLSAIAAAQGFYFSTARGSIPPTFWDVEATYWLCWVVREARLIRRHE